MFFEKQQIDKPYKNIFEEMYYEARPQNNYHGTPYTFNHFDDSKFLTGEGFAAHGPGHYSADYFTTADKYNPGEYSTYEIASKWDNKPVRFGSKYRLDDGFIADKYDIVDYLRKALKEKRPIVDAYLTKSMVDQIPKANHILQNLDSFKEIKEKHVGNTYKVNAPNEYFMWKERLPLSEQTPYVRDAWYRNNFDYGKLLNDWSIDHDLEGIRLPNDKKFWRVYNKSIDHYGEIKPILRRIFSNQMQALDLPDQLKFLARSGNLDKLSEAMGDIKGIRAIGHEDGPINITFSQDNIKMANTPWQRFKNRIPLNSLGTLANKIIASPWFRAANEYVVPASVGLDYLEPLDIIMSKGKEKQQKLQKMFEDVGYEMEIQPDGTYLLKGRI